MSEYGWAERWCRLLLRRRWLAVLAGGAVLVCGVSAARQLSLRVTMTDYYPAGHPHIRLYQDFPEMLQMTNAVVVLVSVRDGDLYNSETLGKIHRLTVGLLGVVAAIHAGVARAYWYLFAGLLGLAFCGGLLGLGSLRAAGLLSLAVALSQAVMLIVLWAATIDLNIHTLPVILAAMGTVVLPASLAIRADAGPASEGWDGLDYALVALATVSLGTALVWLFSPLRLQTEMGLYLLVLSLVNSLLPFSLRALVSPGESAQTPEPAT